MNIKWPGMTSVGPTAWNQGGEPVFVPSMHHQEQKPGETRADGLQRSSPAPERDHLSSSQSESGIAEAKSIPCKTA
jgi:hypothetical protein